MNIIIGEFVLKQNDLSPSRFDMYECVDSERKIKGTDKKEKYKKEKIIGYSMTIERCINEICYERLNRFKSNISLSDFLTEFRYYKNEIKELLEESLLNK